MFCKCILFLIIFLILVSMCGMFSCDYSIFFVFGIKVQSSTLFPFQKKKVEQKSCETKLASLTLLVMLLRLV